MSFRVVMFGSVFLVRRQTAPNVLGDLALSWYFTLRQPEPRFRLDKLVRRLDPLCLPC